MDETGQNHHLQGHNIHQACFKRHPTYRLHINISDALAEKRHEKTLKAQIIQLGFENFRQFLTNQLNYRTFFRSKTCYSPCMINFKVENFKRRKLELVSHLCTDEECQQFHMFAIMSAMKILHSRKRVLTTYFFLLTTTTEVFSPLKTCMTLMKQNLKQKSDLLYQNLLVLYLIVHNGSLSKRKPTCTTCTY